MATYKCSVQGCPTRTKDKITFYCFPKHPRKNAAWTEACQRKDGFVPNAASRICARHFQPQDFSPHIDPRGRRRLKDDITPSINLADQPPTTEGFNVNVVHFLAVPDAGGGGEGEETIVTMDPVAIPAAGVDLSVAAGSEGAVTIAGAAATSTSSLKVNATKVKVTKEKLAQLPPDLEVDANTILSNSKEYFLTLAGTDPSTSAEAMAVANDDEDGGQEASAADPNLESLFAAPDGGASCVSDEQKIKMLASQLESAYRKNATLVRKNKSLRLQLFAASKKTLSQKAKLEVAKEVLSPIFTPAQIDCFCRPDWLRSRNWQEDDFKIAISLRKLMSKKAFSFLRKRRLVPMPSLTTLRKYNKERGIVIQHNTTKLSAAGRGVKRDKSSDATAATTAGNHQPAAKKQRTKSNKSKKAVQYEVHHHHDQQPHHHHATLLYEQFNSLDPNNPQQYIVVENPGGVGVGGDVTGIVVENAGGSASDVTGIVVENAVAAADGDVTDIKDIKVNEEMPQYVTLNGDLLQRVTAAAAADGGNVEFAVQAAAEDEDAAAAAGDGGVHGVEDGGVAGSGQVFATIITRSPDGGEGDENVQMVQMVDHQTPANDVTGIVMQQQGATANDVTNIVVQQQQLDASNTSGLHHHTLHHHHHHNHHEPATEIVTTTTSSGEVTNILLHGEESDDVNDASAIAVEEAVETGTVQKFQDKDGRLRFIRIN